jgi:hypothetical protein
MVLFSPKDNHRRRRPGARLSSQTRHFFFTHTRSSNGAASGSFPFSATISKEKLYRYSSSSLSLHIIVHHSIVFALLSLSPCSPPPSCTCRLFLHSYHHLLSSNSAPSDIARNRQLQVTALNSFTHSFRRIVIMDRLRP